jgi:hypothetical protein
VTELVNLWRFKPSGYVYKFVGELRGDDGVPYALMELGPVTLRVDPLDLVEKDGHWEKVP